MKITRHFIFVISTLVVTEVLSREEEIGSVKVKRGLFGLTGGRGGLSIGGRDSLFSLSNEGGSGLKFGGVNLGIPKGGITVGGKGGGLTLTGQTGSHGAKSSGNGFSLANHGATLNLNNRGFRLTGHGNGMSLSGLSAITGQKGNDFSSAGYSGHIGYNAQDGFKLGGEPGSHSLGGFNF